MNFYEELAKIGKTEVLYNPDFEMPVFSTESRVLNALKEIIQENKKVLLYGDYDPDGAYSVEILKETFNYLGFSNYDTFKYSNRTHSVDVTAVNRALSEKFEYMIICDAGSSDPQLMSRLHLMGIKVILLDHHQSPFSYKDFPNTKMINTTFENRVLDKEIVICSGALTYLICVKLIQMFGKPELESISALALCSLYADVIDMTSDVCRYIYYKAMSLSRDSLPKIIQRFMGEYDVFRRRFIEYRLNPKLNSLFRSESFDLLNMYLSWKPQSNTSIVDIIDKINNVYSNDRKEVSKASDILDHEVLNHFVIGNLSSVAGMIEIPEEKLHNYTGLVANQLATKYNKTAIVYADSGVDVKGSLRDLYGRNYLDLFRKFCDARGHNSAFGIHIKYFEFSEVLSYIKMIDQQFYINTVSNEPIIVPHNFSNPDVSLVNDMALYNEFSGVGSPTAFLSKVWLDTKRPFSSTSYYYKYDWGPFKVKTPTLIRIGSEILIKPYKGWVTRKNGGTELLVSEVNL